jgi:hypothetical protein
MNFFEKHLQFFLLFYLLIGGVFFYLLGATIDTIFVPTVDQPDGFCEEWTERALRWHRAQDCIKFKNRIEELKYKHNKRMEKRSSRKVLFLFLLASGVTYLLMVLRPTLFWGGYGFCDAHNLPGISAPAGGMVSARIYGNSAGQNRADSK